MAQRAPQVASGPPGGVRCCAADPAPVAQTFFADDTLQPNYDLDGIVTVVDAKHLLLHLDDEKPEGVVNEAVEQVHDCCSCRTHLFNLPSVDSLTNARGVTPATLSQVPRPSPCPCSRSLLRLVDCVFGGGGGLGNAPCPRSHSQTGSC